ncbi:Cytochrome P450 86A2 [Phytophthora cinnamomi]|uniref:Cytochrome P450 86A2 n=1 Tax=Phytophthora cinnamomi TaxID=4785 RepID=UPI00355A2635|nr:Cytochrome P450 86A2 [Phytophthora cinnamomi]
MDEQAAAAATAPPTKNGQQMLAHLLAIAYHVLDETKHMNLKPPLRPSSKLFAADAPQDEAPRSPVEADAPQDEAPPDVNGLAAGFAGGHAHAGGAQGHPVVIPYAPEEIQDTYSKIAALKAQYIKVSAELLEAVKEVEKRQEPRQGDKDATAKLVQRRNQLRKEVYERNLVMKGLIDRLRNLQHSIRLMKGGSAYPPNIVMESV